MYYNEVDQFILDSAAKKTLFQNVHLMLANHLDDIFGQLRVRENLCLSRSVFFEIPRLSEDPCYWTPN